MLSLLLLSATTPCHGRVSRANRIDDRIERDRLASPRIWKRCLAVAGQSSNPCSSVCDAKLHRRQTGSMVL